ncbi:ATPase family AAA domain-containing protein 1-A [Vitis vinifera]|uniref:ATPase family AAA domain-containing protein 1-A n=1 Tax=Vitis vinifera TaxID=29760 RepID=A0A438EDB0_VITVI|nr:ATPase family AAA domain-containing protein 1-A [Vitis vinifera]
MREQQLDSPVLENYLFGPLSSGQRGEVYEVNGDRVAVILDRSEKKPNEGEEDEKLIDQAEKPSVYWMQGLGGSLYKLLAEVLANGLKVELVLELQYQLVEGWLDAVFIANAVIDTRLKSGVMGLACKLVIDKFYVKDIEYDLDTEGEDRYIAMEALCEVMLKVLHSTQPLIVYFPDSSQWLLRAVSKPNQKEFVCRVQEMFDQLSGPVVLICGQNKTEAGSKEREKFTMLVPGLGRLAKLAHALCDMLMMILGNVSKICYHLACLDKAMALSYNAIFAMSPFLEMKPVPLKQLTEGLKATKTSENNEILKLFSNVICIDTPKALKSRKRSFLAAFLEDKLVKAKRGDGIILTPVSPADSKLIYRVSSSLLRIVTHLLVLYAGVIAGPYLKPLLIYGPWASRERNPRLDEELLRTFNKQVEEDRRIIISRSNLNELHKVLEEHQLSCMDLLHVNTDGVILTKQKAEKIVGWAKNHYLSSCMLPSIKGERLSVPRESLEIAVLRLKVQEAISRKPSHSLKNLAKDEYESNFVSAVVPPGEIGVKFDDIGALEDVKKALNELVILPMRRPELFSHGNLLRPCKGILLFGPPGTGKTLLAKALATEAGANFISVTGSNLTSKWFGDAEKLTKALFSFAGKLAPVIIFVDEVDSLLGARGGAFEHEATRKMRNEFMAAWDGLRSKDNQRIIILGATNRPFDLDEAVIRRLPRRIYVDLPDAENRMKILRIFLASENIEPGFQFDKLANATEGYSGSDLKNLCVAAAYRPVQELLEEEQKDISEACWVNLKQLFENLEKLDCNRRSRRALDVSIERAKNGRQVQKLDNLLWRALLGPQSALRYSTLNVGLKFLLFLLGGGGDILPPVLRSLTLDDFIKSKAKVGPSVAFDAASMNELRKWNEQYGEGGSRRKSLFGFGN